MAIIEIKAEITGNVWTIQVRPGDQIDEDTPILILESMKMEIPIVATDGGKVVDILVSEGDTVQEGATIARLEV
ncbi:biotin/lipoyl-binding carrier protein [Pararhizobium haloflavum]|uniref:biotin/lipoyl-binding carrier protein n=1 Tax=Pararhizobium haloflavum TaxID=2037914 RepID=UPI000C185929|nr:biotin/lipoyl-binding carrier protein [Pararhizobium haloflavum]